jgi:hypothetical protein
MVGSIVGGLVGVLVGLGVFVGLGVLVNVGGPDIVDVGLGVRVGIGVAVGGTQVPQSREQAEHDSLALQTRSPQPAQPLAFPIGRLLVSPVGATDVAKIQPFRPLISVRIQRRSALYSYKLII